MFSNCLNFVPLIKRRMDNSLLFSLSSNHGCGDTTRTCDLQVMSLASYQLLHSAMFLICDCKGNTFMRNEQIFIDVFCKTAEYEHPLGRKKDTLHFLEHHCLHVSNTFSNFAHT